MRKLIGRTSKKAGLAPGALVFVGEQRHEEPKISIVDYDADHIEEREETDIGECLVFRDTPTVSWINVSGIHDVSTVEKLGTCYGVHPLVLEDILNTKQRPKLEEFEGYLFIALKMLSLDRESPELIAHHISLIVGPNFVISFQETEDDVFEVIRQRIRNGRGRVRAAGSDYLAYALVDAVVDNYFVVLEQLAERIEEVEEELVSNPSTETMQTIYSLKRELIFLRRSVWPLREAIAGLGRTDSPIVSKETHPYLRDVYDHTIQVIDTIESFRDVVSGMHDTYLSSVSNRMNEVMKVLTIIATIFIPLTFLAGMYGMNFHHMPELAWRWAYPGIWAVMAAVTLGMVFYFRRRHWL